jgi:alpha,alpha-trehalose phosphorylase
MRLYLDDEPFTLATANLLSFERALNMREGTLDRELVWETPAGKHVSIKSRRLVSLEHRHLGAIHYELTVLNADAPVVISSKIRTAERVECAADDPRGTRRFTHQVLVPQMKREVDRRLVLGYEAANSKMTLGCGIDHHVEADCPFTYEMFSADDRGKVVFSFEAKAGVPIRITKAFAYHTSRRPAVSELCDRTERTVMRALTQGFETLLQSQKTFLDDFWQRSDVVVRGDPDVQQAIRFNLYQLCQATARAEGVGVPAKGLTGEGYEGHYFWDTEVYVVPFLTYTDPRIARNLLKFRHSYLDKARERARQVNQAGALFPWRTINGEEASAYYAAGTAQYHINADIVYALRKYVHASGDEDFLFGPGVEILIETARLWCDIGFFSARRGGKFCIQGVTGPDEYNTVVNNNTFTNLMARENLWYAAATVKRLQQERPKRHAAMVHELDLAPEEPEQWQRAADQMYVPYDEELCINPQDDDFLDRKVWDFDNVPHDKYPLLLHFHPLVIYRHQVIKQADVILATFLLGDEFSAEQKQRNFDFYDPLTTGDSSLSACIQSIVASEVGYQDKAAEYARYAGLMDLADVHGNVKDGCHIASMGGFWMALIYGFAGMRDHDGELSFRPRGFRNTRGMSFKLTVRGQRLAVDIDGEKRMVTYRLEEGAELIFKHEDEEVKLTSGSRVTLPFSA